MNHVDYYYWLDEENVVQTMPQVRQPTADQPPAPFVRVGPTWTDVHPIMSVSDNCVGPSGQAATHPSGTTDIPGGEDIEAPPAEPLPRLPTPTETPEQRLARLKEERKQHLVLAGALLLGIASGFVMDRRS
jgi:hypothetical protein